MFETMIREQRATANLRARWRPLTARGLVVAVVAGVLMGMLKLGAVIAYWGIFGGLWLPLVLLAAVVIWYAHRWRAALADTLLIAGALSCGHVVGALLSVFGQRHDLLGAVSEIGLLTALVFVLGVATAPVTLARRAPMTDR